MQEEKNNNNPDNSLSDKTSDDLQDSQVKTEVKETPEVETNSGESVTSNNSPASTGGTNEQPVATESTPNEASPANTGGVSLTTYVLSGLIILVMCGGLWFFLEREGRVNTSVFSGLISTMEDSGPVARVNGENISREKYNDAISQATIAAGEQGLDTSDEALMADIEAQTIETLITTELLLQETEEAGIEVTDEEVEERYQEIQTQVGGEEEMNARMNEVGLDEAQLRSDVRDELSIQKLFETELDFESLEVDEGAVEEFYNESGGAEGGLPPIEDVAPQIESQLIFTLQQELVDEYITSLRESAEVEVLTE